MPHLQHVQHLRLPTGWLYAITHSRGHVDNMTPAHACRRIYRAWAKSITKREMEARSSWTGLPISTWGKAENNTVVPMKATYEEVKECLQNNTLPAAIQEVPTALALTAHLVSHCVTANYYTDTHTAGVGRSYIPDCQNRGAQAATALPWGWPPPHRTQPTTTPNVKGDTLP